MANDPALPIGLRLRRARRAAKLSQAEVARRASVSQPLVSYYERSLGDAEGEGVARIASVLGVDLRAAPRESPEPARPEPEGLDAHRRALLSSIARCGLPASLFDRPAAGAGGDLAFALSLWNHVYVCVVDGTGRGSEATVSGLLRAHAILGALELARGVVWPDELLAAVARVPRDGAAKRRGAATFVAVIDAKNHLLTWGSIDFPSAWLRTGGRAAPLRGERTGLVQEGRVVMTDDWLLLVGTDGLAHAPARDGVLWDTRALRQLVSEARRPRDLTRALEQRLGQGALEDDALALVVSAP